MVVGVIFMVKKIIRSTSWTVTIISLVFLVCSCWLIPTYHHRPHYLYQADVIFEDNEGNKVFSDERKRKVGVYVPDDPDYNQGLYIKNAGHTNYERAVANSKYLIIMLSYPEVPNYYFIMVFDKSYNVIKTINFEDYEKVQDIACTDNNLYILLKNRESEKLSLLKYGFDSDLISTLIDDLANSKSYQDDDVHLFFMDYWYYVSIYKYENSKTRLFMLEGHCKTDKVDLCLSNNGKYVIVNNEGKEYSAKIDLNISYYFYSKAYLIDNHLVFAIFKESGIHQCGYSGCICSLQESYLYKYELISNELTLIKQFDKGTFLIDYDLDGYKYYRDGGLYINDVLFRECENIYPEYVEHLTNEKKMYYYFSYYNGEFYGI